jgi:benzodiazapine receptor
MIIQILICVGIVELLGYLSVYFTKADIGSVYTTLQSDYPNVLYPPQWLFSPVWITLYAMLGFVLAVNLPSKTERSMVFLLLITGLGLNFIWSPLYFGGERRYALYSILGMNLINLFIVGYLIDIIMYSHKVTDILSLVFISLYSTWIGFATYLNASTV